MAPHKPNHGNSIPTKKIVNNFEPQMVEAKQLRELVHKRSLTEEEEEEKITKVKHAYESRHYPSMRAAAIAHNVPYDTLCHSS